MTVREIAEIAGVSTETVRIKTRELFPEKIKNGKRTVFLQKEAVKIMADLRKKGFVQATENLEVPTKNLEVKSLDVNNRLDRLEQLVEKLLLVTGNLLQVQQSNQTQEKRVLLPAPQLDARAHIKKMIDEYVSRNGIEHSDAYRYLYREFFYRTHCNASLCAKNRGMKTIDYIDDEGMIETLEAIAMEVL